MNIVEFIENEKYNYMFYLANSNNTGNTIYPISFGFECNKGWYPMIMELIEKIAKLDTDKELRIFQIKEKFGGLRFYIEGGTSKEIYDLIDEYEKKSYSICEICGDEGHVRSDLSWIRTLCDKHYDEIKNTKLRQSVVVNAPVFKMKTKG